MKDKIVIICYKGINITIEKQMQCCEVWLGGAEGCTKRESEMEREWERRRENQKDLEEGREGKGGKEEWYE